MKNNINKIKRRLRYVYAFGMALNAFMGCLSFSAITALAVTPKGTDGSGSGGGGTGSGGTGTTSADGTAGTVITKLKDVMTTIGKYVGMGLLVFGAYEVIMSFLQQQPEAKVKGILMCVCGGVMMTIGDFIKGLGV